MEKLTHEGEEMVSHIYEIIRGELSHVWESKSKEVIQALIEALASCAMQNIEKGKRGEIVKALEDTLHMYEQRE